MATTEMNDLIRFLAEGIVLADPEGLQQLAALHEKLVHAQKLLKDDDARLAACAASAASGLERIMLRECEDAGAVLAETAASISMLQAALLDGRPIEEALGTSASEESEPAGVAVATPVDVEAGEEATCVNDGDAPANGDALTDAGDASSASVAMPAIASATLLTGDADLTADFITESREHLDAANVSLLTIEGNPSDGEALNAVFRAFHTIKGVAGFLELTAIQALAHESETLLDKCRKGELKLQGPALDAVFDATDVMKQLVDAVAQALAGDRRLHLHPALPALVPRIRAATEGRALAAPAKAGRAPVAAECGPDHESECDSESNEASTTQTAAGAPRAEEGSTPAALASPSADAKATSGQAVVKETVRVDAERLDKLVDIIGEMVIAEAMVSQSSEFGSRGSSKPARLMNHLDKITRELQELAMSLRMVPVRSAFQRMARLARDVSKKLGKPIDFVTAGDETELDKNVVDAIGDPLVHMVRNAVDHGLEGSVEERRKAGKSDNGRVELRAFHKGGSIYIEIEDDGRGLDCERILAKAIERGIVKEGETLTESEIFNLVFEPGFSTAKQITDVSGRGVGLDVVKRNIQALRGKTEIRSVKGKGTVFSIRLPLTLAIIEGMVVRVDQQRFIIPTLSIVRMIRPEQANMAMVFARGEMLKMGDRLVPLHRLERLFAIEGAIRNPFEAAVIVVEHDNRQVAFLVDELLGQQQIVIKPLGAMLRQYPGFTGGAIMPDGRVGLILDVAGLISMAGATEASRHAA